VLITREAGLGKTRLAEQFLEWASQQGIMTARSRSYDTEGQLTDVLRMRLSKLDDEP